MLVLIGVQLRVYSLVI